MHHYPRLSEYKWKHKAVNDNYNCVKNRKHGFLFFNKLNRWLVLFVSMAQTGGAYMIVV